MTLPLEATSIDDLCAGGKLSVAEQEAVITYLLDLLPARLLPKERIDSALSPENETGTYRFWQVESLLNDAADLLDGCLERRREAQELWTRLAQTSLELLADDFSNSELIQEKADKAWAFKSAELRQKDLELAKFTPNHFWPVSMADLGLLPTRKIIDNSVTLGFNAAQGSAQGNASRETNLAGLARNSSVLQLMNYVLEGKERERLIFNEELALARKHTSVGNLCILRKIKRSLTKEGGPLDFGARIRQLIDFQLAPDLMDAIDRCAAARKGLKEIYGWSDTFCPLPTYSASPEWGSSFVEEIHKWVNDAIRWLLRFSHLDQAFSVSVSLGPLPQGEWQKFHISEALFDTHDYVRVRGLSAFVETESAAHAAPFRVDVRLPENAAYRFDDDHRKPIIQNVLPTCRLGRVAGRDSHRDPEIGGTVSLVNASPIGQDGSEWWILVNSIAEGANSPAIDVQLELSLTGRVRLPKAEGGRIEYRATTEVENG